MIGCVRSTDDKNLRCLSTEFKVWNAGAWRCGASFQWVMHAEKFVPAIRRNNQRRKVGGCGNGNKARTSRLISQSQTAEDERCCLDVAKFTRTFFKESPAPWRFAKRGIDNAEAIEPLQNRFSVIEARLSPFDQPNMPAGTCRSRMEAPGHPRRTGHD